MSLRAKLIRLAHAKPELRSAILPLLVKDAAAKTAMSPDTELFISWVIAIQKPMSPDTVQRFLERHLGRTPTEPAESKPRKTGPLEVGEPVFVDSYKNTNPANTDAAKHNHNRIGIVDSISTDGMTIAFYAGDKDHPSKDMTGDKQFFEGKASGKTTGLYRNTSVSDYVEHAVEKRLGFEVIYFSEKPTVDRRRLEQIQKYVEKGMEKGEDRKKPYLTGLIGKFAYGKDGNMYFGIAAQQRDVPTTISPSKGQVLYIGILGHRPGGWMRDVEEMVETEALSESQAAE